MFSNFPTDDPRLGQILQPGAKGDVVLLGFPHDEGVRRNGGRVGAKKGPSVAREMIKKVGTIVNLELDIDLRALRISDAGDIDHSLNLEEGHDKLAARVAEILDADGVPFVIGGGNDQSYPNACGLLRSKGTGSIGVVNIDAHLDVRPLKDNKVHSGSPFRLLLLDPHFQQRRGRFVEFAAQGSQCSAEHVNWLKSNGGTIVWLKDILKTSTVESFETTLENLGDEIFVSFDLDVVRSSDAPGVSCASPTGLSAQDALDICFEAGKNPKVKLFDLSEFNPDIESYRTARLVAFMFYYFCLGFAVRKGL